jgi:ketosteroid isomerase-like protein
VSVRALLVALATCGGATHPAASRPPTLADCAWLQGTWHAAELEAHWQLVDGALYGIALDAHGGFEVNIIDDSDEDGHPAPITLVSLENGRDPMRFALHSATAQELDFADAQHRTVRITKTASGWRGAFTQPGRPPVAFDMQAGALAHGEQLAAADRAFAADTAARGADGWTAHFAEGGAIWRPAGRVEGAAMHDRVAGMLARGPLRWQPVASGARGDVGFTLGTYTFGGLGGPAVTHGSYATIWQKQPDGSWKVVFDIGRPG